jgi:hypothetical protein
MRVRDAVKQSAVFVGYYDDPNDPNTEHLVGTGTLIGINEGGIDFPYLVTADHLVRTMPGKPPGLAERNSAFARIFEPDGHSVEVPLFRDPVPPKDPEIPTPPSMWVRHPTDSGVDAAAALIIPFRPWANRDLKVMSYIPIDIFVSDTSFGSEKLGIGDEVFICGVFGYPRSRALMSPILRIGNLAAIPSERIPIEKPFGSTECYLIESRSIGGLSGSPVFIRETLSVRGDDDEDTGEKLTWRDNGVYATGNFYFLGIVHGHWDIGLDDLNNVDIVGARENQLGRNAPGVNMGIAIVTPAQKIRDILFREDLIEQRRDFVSEYEKQNQASAPTLDESA